MANGDAAAAAGLLTVASTASVQLGYDEINRTRDYLVTRQFPTNQIKDGNVTDAKLQNKQVYRAGSNTFTMSWASPRIRVAVSGVGNIDLATSGDVSGLTTQINAKRSLNNGDFTTTIVSTGDIGCAGRMQAVGSRSFTVSSSWAAAALDGSGYLGIQPSARRFRQDIQPRVYTLEQAAQIGRLVVAYRLKSAVEANPDATGEVGIIAEALLEAGFPEFVVFDQDGEVQTINYQNMVTVCFSALTEVASRLVALEGR